MTLNLEAILKELNDVKDKINEIIGEVVTFINPPAPPKPPAPPAPPAESTVTKPMTPEELNEIMIAEFNRIGDKDLIFGVLKELGVTGITELPADKYQTLIDKVKAIEKAV